ncbi:MAG: zinc ribbon domain-containing protein [Gemmatimonadetes bacterium]|nr:zinc ribbon domain-containing protein [Gemmatimonadota bacterium]
MPTYEFRCPDGSIIERIFKISEVPSEIPAPDGSGMAVRIISGGAALIFKGSGFYITDYGKDGKKDQRTASSPSESSSGKSESKGDSKSESKGDSKSESKGESKPTGGSAGSGGTSSAPSSSAPSKPSSSE